MVDLESHGSPGPDVPSLVLGEIVCVYVCVWRFVSSHVYDRDMIVTKTFGLSSTRDKGKRRV